MDRPAGEVPAVLLRRLPPAGNLILTGHNAELGNLPFSDKKKLLANTHIELNRWILEQNVWGAEEIISRADVLLNTSKQLWPGPL
ncbi:MAG TPA: HNH endonuclease family protein [Tepidisphaeraceae bacterium]|jgi:hypothetical protein|nr:HNH endonuclease family protein [Tepidisphaeraceae bacterium]